MLPAFVPCCASDFVLSVQGNSYDSRDFGSGSANSNSYHYRYVDCMPARRHHVLEKAF